MTSRFKLGKTSRIELGKHRGLNSENIEDWTRKHRGLNSENDIEDWTRKTSRIELGKWYRGLNSDNIWKTVRLDKMPFRLHSWSLTLRTVKTSYVSRLASGKVGWLLENEQCPLRNSSSSQHWLPTDHHNVLGFRLLVPPGRWCSNQDLLPWRQIPMFIVHSVGQEVIIIIECVIKWIESNILLVGVLRVDKRYAKNVHEGRIVVAAT